MAEDPALPASRPGVLPCRLAPRWQRQGLLGDVHAWTFSCLLIVPEFDISTQISWLIAQYPPLPSPPSTLMANKTGFARAFPRFYPPPWCWGPRTLSNVSLTPSEEWHPTGRGDLCAAVAGGLRRVHLFT